MSISSFLKRFSVTILTSICCVSSIEATLIVPNKATIHQRTYTFSDTFEIESDIGFQGNLVKSKMALRTSYEYYNPEGEIAATAYLRIFSLGAVYTWAGVLDIYDGNGRHIGCIEGTALTFLPSKFSFYNANDELKGTAYMDHDAMGFTILDPVKEKKSFVHFRRIFVKELVDHWDITINNPTAIDLRILYAFGAFILDNQSDFRLDD